MAATYGRIYFAMDDCPECYITLQHCPSLSGLLTFANVLSGLTRASITRCEFVTVEWCDHAQTDGEYENLNLRGIIKFRDADEGRLWCIPLPAPRSEIFEQSDSKMKLKQSIGEYVTNAYSLMSAQEFTYEHGWLVGNTY